MSSFASLTTGTATVLFYDYTLTRDMMKANCRKALTLGDEKLRNPKAKTRHITVIMNPIAGKRKSKKLYTKWVEPLLHLAGIKVSLVETDSPNQAYNLMKIMSDCDGVAIVGGDGTVHEVINGLMHRQDRARAAKELPIAIIPTGQYNSIARYIHQGIPYRNHKELLIRSTMMLVDSVTEQHDVLEVKPLEAPSIETSEHPQPVYVLRDLRYGLYQDNYLKLSGFMFYQTKIKPLWLRFKNIFTNPNPKPRINSLSYSEPCEGCSRCVERHTIANLNRATADEVKSSNRKWWSVVAPVPRKSPSKEELRLLELSKRDNPNCDRFISISDTSNITDFRVSMMGNKKIRLSLSTEGRYKPDHVVEAQDVRLEVSPELDAEYQAKLEQEMKSSQPPDSQEDLSKSGTDDPSDIVKQEFLIDGQKAQIRSLNVTSISNALTIFTGLPEIV